MGPIMQINQDNAWVYCILKVWTIDIMFSQNEDHALKS